MASASNALTTPALPSNAEKFGGVSGGGLWRHYFVENEDAPKVTAAILFGAASWQIDQKMIVCRGWDRIDRALSLKYASFIKP